MVVPPCLMTTTTTHNGTGLRALDWVVGLVWVCGWLCLI